MLSTRLINKLCNEKEIIDCNYGNKVLMMVKECVIYLSGALTLLPTQAILLKNSFSLLSGKSWLKVKSEIKK